MATIAPTPPPYTPTRPAATAQAPVQALNTPDPSQTGPAPGQPPNGQAGGKGGGPTVGDALMQMTNKMVFDQFSAMEEQRAEDDGE